MISALSHYWDYWTLHIRYINKDYVKTDFFLHHSKCYEIYLGFPTFLIPALCKEGSAKMSHFFFSSFISISVIWLLAILHISKSQVRPNMEYSFHICAGAAHSSFTHYLFTTLDRVPKRFLIFVGNIILLQPSIPFLRTKTSQASRWYITIYMGIVQTNNIHEFHLL